MCVVLVVLCVVVIDVVIFDGVKLFVVMFEFKIVCVEVVRGLVYKYVVMV